jgi:hypothetical protein
MHKKRPCRCLHICNSDSMNTASAKIRDGRIQPISIFAAGSVRLSRLDSSKSQFFHGSLLDPESCCEPFLSTHLIRSISCGCITGVSGQVMAGANWLVTVFSTSGKSPMHSSRKNRYGKSASRSNRMFQPSSLKRGYRKQRSAPES